MPGISACILSLFAKIELDAINDFFSAKQSFFQNRRAGRVNRKPPFLVLVECLLIRGVLSDGRGLYIYCYSSVYTSVYCEDLKKGNEGLACLPMGADAYDKLIRYSGPDRCICGAGEYLNGTTCQACPAGGAPHPPPSQHALRILFSVLGLLS
jgi:hypothetical protein